MVGRRSMDGDTGNDAQRLHKLLLECSSRDIVAACAAVEAQLHSVGGDHVRDFYRLCFPILLRKIFGFEDPSGVSAPSAGGGGGGGSAAGGWLGQASLPGNEASARALIALLSPRGSLFSSLLEADKENYVRYVFPMERLPEWIPRLLAMGKGAEMLRQVSALFKNRITEDANGCMQVHLDVFEYYMFWFAYYAVCKDTNSSLGLMGGRPVPSTASRSSQLRMQLESWKSSIPGLHSPQATGAGGSPYLQLLKLYLTHFVVKPSKGYPGQELQLADGGVASQGDKLIYTLVEFWLVDSDPSPLPSAIMQSLGFRAMQPSTVMSYIPPGTSLTESLRVLIKFLNSNLRSSIGEQLVASEPFPVLEPSSSFRRKGNESSSGQVSSPLSPSPSFGGSLLPLPSSGYLQVLQRPLYRFLLRAFRLWPVGTSVTKIYQVVDVWLDYLEPWNTGLDAANAREEAQRHWSRTGSHKGRGESHQSPLLSPGLSHKNTDGSPSGGALAGRGSDQRVDMDVYSEPWQGYVLANYHFYSSLLIRFLEFSLKFVHMDPEAVFQMVYKVLHVLARSKELLDLLQKVDLAYGGRLYGHRLARNNALLDLVPTIQEQLQDWEGDAEMSVEQEQRDALVLSSTPHRGAPAPSLLFGSSDNGAHRLLQALFMRAESEIQSSSSEKPPLNARTLESVKDAAQKIFGLHTLDRLSGSLQPGYYQGSLANLGPEYKNEASPSRGPGLQRHSWQDVKYKGDWMRRPIDSTEVAFLVRLFVSMSDFINTTLGFTKPAVVNVNELPMVPHEDVQGETDQSQPVEVVLPTSSRQNEIKFSDILVLAEGMLWQLLLVLQLEIQNRGWRVNLRFMAGKKFLVLITLGLLFYWAVRAITSCISPYIINQ